MVYARSIKPILDFTGALVLLLVAFPLLLAITLLLFAHFKGNPFFAQTRIGIEETPFSMLKFRTMHGTKEKTGSCLSDDERISKLGHILRRTGLDELPQLWNILKGEMSFVGPRPLLPEYLPLYTFETKKRHTVKPGVTGLAQVNGGNSLEWGTRFEFDIFYVKNTSFLLDLKILFRTFTGIFKTKKGTNIGPFQG